MALGLTQPLTEMNTRNIFWGVKAAGAWGWHPYHLHVPIVLKSGSFNFLEPSGPVLGLLYLYRIYGVRHRSDKCHPPDQHFVYTRISLLRIRKVWRRRDFRIFQWVRRRGLVVDRSVRRYTLEVFVNKVTVVVILLQSLEYHQSQCPDTAGPRHANRHLCA